MPKVKTNAVVQVRSLFILVTFMDYLYVSQLFGFYALALRSASTASKITPALAII